MDKIKSLLDQNKIEELEAYLESDEALDLSYQEKNEHFITSHKLGAFKLCQYSYWLEWVKKETPRVVEDSDALLIGQAFDYLMTNGEEKFNEKYAAVSRRSGKSEKKELTLTQSGTIKSMYDEFKQQNLFDKAPKKKVFITNFSGFWLKAELDNFDGQFIRDIKTTANITTFDPNDYIFQMAFYQFVVEERTGQKCEAILEVVDKYAWFSRSAGYHICKPTLERRRGEILSALEALRDAQDTDIWIPSKNQNVRFNSKFYGVDGFGRPQKYIYL